jgi:hypothetical protein
VGGELVDLGFRDQTEFLFDPRQAYPY